jgi:acyl-lipid (8-3)-desaturase
MYAPDVKGFYATLRSRVRAHFEARGVHPKDPWGGVVRLLLMLPCAALLFCVANGLLFPAAPFALKVASALAFGVAQAMPLLHVMHDASHTSIGRTAGWWRFMGIFSLDFFAGGSMTTWAHQHILGHHV